MEQKAKTEAELELWERDMLMLDEEEADEEVRPEAEPCGEEDFENFRFVAQNTGRKKVAKRESERTALAPSSAEVLSQSVTYLVGGEESFSWTVEELIEIGKEQQKECTALGNTHAIIHEDKVARLQLVKELSEMTNCVSHWIWRIMSRILLQQFLAAGGKSGTGRTLEEYRRFELPNENLWKIVGEAERKYAKRTDDNREREDIPWKTNYIRRGVGVAAGRHADTHRREIAGIQNVLQPKGECSEGFLFNGIRKEKIFTNGDDARGEERTNRDSTVEENAGELKWEDTEDRYL